MNKKLLSVLICMLLVFVAAFVVSCGDDQADTSGGATTDTSTTTDTGNEQTPPEPPAPSECTVTFVFENGDEDVNKTVKYNEKIRDIPRDPQKAGYEFKGWLYNNTPWNPDKRITENMTVVASWKANNNTLSFLPNGASNTMNPMVIPSNTTVTLNDCTLVKKGCNFIGWATEEGGEVVYQNGAEYTMGTEKSNHLYAVWSNATYEITYELDGGVNAEGNPTTYMMDSPVSFLDASKEGYTFEGWTCNGEPIENTEGLASDLTLVANFELIRYNITYIGVENGTNPNPSDFNVEDEIIFAAPSIDGFRFLGWYKDENHTVPFEKIDLNTETDVTVYASFEILPFTITYIVPDILTNKNERNEFTVETEYTFSDAEVNTIGYKFTGWYLEGTDEKVEALVPNTFSQNITLEARYSLIQYSITYATEDVPMPDDAPLYYTIEDVSKSFTLPELNRYGYSFDGWYTSHPDTDVYEGSISSIEINPQDPKDITVFAKFTLDTYTITYVIGDIYGTTNSNPKTYDIINPVTFAPLVTSNVDYTFIAWYTDDSYSRESLIKSTAELEIPGDITIYARWAEGDNLPIIQIKNEDVTMETNSYHKDKLKLDCLFDGVKETTGIFAYGDKEWYAQRGETLTITLNEEVELQMVYAYVMGNWTKTSHTFYDKNGEEVYKKEEVIGEISDSSPKVVVFEASETQPTIRVKTIVIKVTELKWEGVDKSQLNDARTHKISEYEIFATNANYIDPDKA